MTLARRLDASVALVAAAAHAGVLRNGFAVDDVAIAANPLLQRVATLPAAMAAPWWHPDPHLYRPLATLMIGAELLLAHGAAWLPHLVNVALHAGIAVLVSQLARRWLQPIAAAGAGACFALLPAHAEAVGTIVGQAELLAAAALMGTMLVVTRVAAPTPRSRLAVFVLAVVALASKEGGVTAPVLALGAAWALPRARPYAWTNAFAALAGIVVLLLARLIVLGTLGGDRAHPAFRTLGPWRRLVAATSMLPHSAAMLLLPVPPAINYVPPWQSVLHPSPGALLVGVMLVAGGLALLVAHVRHPSVTTLGALIVAVTLAPTANLLFASGVAVSGRGMYAPSIGTALLSGALLAALARRAPSVAGIVATGYLLACAVVTVREGPVWRSSASALAAAEARGPDSYWVPRGRAYLARDAGRPAEALGYFRRAATLMPVDWEMLTDGATVALAAHDTVDAERWLAAAVAAHPGTGRARVRLDALRRTR